MPTFPGVGERIKERLRALGYVRPGGELRVQEGVGEACAGGEADPAPPPHRWGLKAG